MSRRIRPSARKKTLHNVMCSSLSETDKKCIEEVFARFDQQKARTEILEEQRDVYMQEASEYSKEIDILKAEKEALIAGQETLQKALAEKNAEVERLKYNLKAVSQKSELNEKDRLIKILKTILPTRGTASGIPIIQKWNYDEVADQLINNCVLVLPYKVGDTVYQIDEHYTECTPFRERYSKYACAGCECSCDSRKERYIRPVEITNIHWIFNMWDYFGKTVFLTKEAAERALKEGADNVQSKT